MRIVWSVLAVLYLVFFYWYTSFGGPLTPQEIDHYVGLMQERGGASAERIADVRRFLEEDTGDDFAMVNVIQMREPPERVAGVAPDDTAADVLAKYMEHMWPQLLRRASHPVTMGTAAAKAMDVWGIEGAEVWSTAAFMRYRSRRDLMEIASNPDFQGPHEFKIASMWKTIAFPIDPWFHLGDPRLLLGRVFLIVGLVLQRFSSVRGA